MTRGLDTEALAYMSPSERVCVRWEDMYVGMSYWELSSSIPLV